MRKVIKSDADPGDSVSIERHTPMTNTELTLDQLQTINGAAAFMKLGDIRGEYRQVIHPNYKAGYHTPFGTARNRLGSSTSPNVWTNGSATS